MVAKKYYQAGLNAYRPFEEGFIGKYQRLIKNKVIPYQYDILNDKVEGACKSHVVANFENAAKALRGEDNDGFYGMVFQDSDAGKWIEAVAYSLALFPDKALEETADALIDVIGKAQDEDGYLDTYFTIKDRDKRFTNLQEAHELYCAGHLMEAAVAYYETTGKDKFLKIMHKNAECIYERFITGKAEGYPGHPEIEMALLRMYRATGDEKCLELAQHFIDIRGVDPKFYTKEKASRDWSVWDSETEHVDYMQAHMSVRQQKDAVGHAVRAVYLYTAMADLASQIGDESLYRACENLWDSIVNRRMYITGGIGSTNLGEAFTADYNLPPDTAYCETCASIGLMFFASRMLEINADGKYADVMERAFYNTVLGGMELSGERFFYVNPLEIIPGISGKIATHMHDLPQRPTWYACACCPPNAARLISSFGKYAYGENADTVLIHMYAAGDASFENGLCLSCKTNYPYEFKVTYEVTAGEGKLMIRIPGWSGESILELNGKVIFENKAAKGDAYYEKGYVCFYVKEGDLVSLSLYDKPYYVYPSAQIANLTGMVSVGRGPLVYCFEGKDNGGDVLSLRIDDSTPPVALSYDKDTLKGIVPIEVAGYKEKKSDALYSVQKPEKEKVLLKAIPYYTWGNRGENQMRVWMGR